MRCILLNIFGIHFLSIFWRSWKYFIHQTDLNYNHIIDSSKLIESITEITSSFLNFKFLVSLNQSSKKFLKETIILLKHYHKRSYLLLWSLSSNLPSHTTIDFFEDSHNSSSRISDCANCKWVYARNANVPCSLIIQSWYIVDGSTTYTYECKHICTDYKYIYTHTPNDTIDCKSSL